MIRELHARMRILCFPPRPEHRGAPPLQRTKDPAPSVAGARTRHDPRRDGFPTATISRLSVF